ALDRGPLQTRQSDYMIGFELPVGCEHERSVLECDRVRARTNTDSALSEQFRDCGAGDRPEDLQRRLLVRDDDDLEVRETGCGLQGELVQRQRPADRTGQREDDASCLALRELAEQRAECLAVRGPAE